MKLRATLAGLLTEAREQYRGDLRLRRAILVMGLLLGLFALDRLALWSASLDGRIASAADRLARTEQAAAQPMWLQRARRAEILRERWEAGLWRHPSAGLAQASAQTWLERRLADAAVEDARVKVSPAVPVGEDPALQQLVAEVVGDFEPASFLAFLTALEGNEPRLAIRRLAVSASRRARFDMAVYVWLRIEEDANDG